MIFIDTGAFVARYLKRDQHHAQAKRAWQVLMNESGRVCTSNFVIGETLTLLGRKVGYEFAAARGRQIYASTSLEVLRSGAEHELEALRLLEKYTDQAIGFTDCVSFVLMRRLQIKRAFSFDRDFRVVGFEIWPGESM